MALGPRVLGVIHKKVFVNFGIFYSPLPPCFILSYSIQTFEPPSRQNVRRNLWTAPYQNLLKFSNRLMKKQRHQFVSPIQPGI